MLTNAQHITASTKETPGKRPQTKDYRNWPVRTDSQSSVMQFAEKLRAVRTPSLPDDEGGQNIDPAGSAATVLPTHAPNYGGKGKQAQSASIEARPQFSVKTPPPQKKSPGLPAIRPVPVPSSPNPQARPVQPRNKRTQVGHPDRMTQWADFSLFVPPSCPTEPEPSSPGHPDLNKPLPRVPSPTSHLRVTRYFGEEPLFASQLERKRSHRATSVYAGEMIVRLSGIVGDDPAISPAHSPTTFPTPGTTDDEYEDEYEDEEAFRHRFDFDDDDDDARTPVVDTFIHPGHTSFLVTERLDGHTLRSERGRQERVDGDSQTPVTATFSHRNRAMERLEGKTVRSSPDPLERMDCEILQNHSDGSSPDPSQAIWGRLAREAGGSWGAES